MSLGRRLASQSGAVFSARLVGAGLVFLAQAVMARAWGPQILGDYLLVVAAVNLLAVVMPLGFQTIGTYFAAEYAAKGDRASLLAFLARAYGFVLAIGAACWAAGPAWALVPGPIGAILRDYWPPALLLAVATALVFVNGAVLVGLRRPLAGFFADALFRPMAVTGAVLLGLQAIAPQQAFATVLTVLSALYALVAAGHFALVVSAVRRVPATAPARAGEARRWWRFALPWMIIGLATDFYFDLDLLLLSGQLGRDELAIFGICTRIFSLAAFGVAAVYAVVMPDMFESAAQADRQGFHRKLGDANLIATGMSLALAVGAGLGGWLLLMLFGPAFVAGTIPLGILCCGLVVRAVFGPASLVLSIHDHPYASLPAVALGLGVLVLGNAALVPALGLVGAALAALAGMTAWSACLWGVALRTTGVDVSILPRLRRRAELAGR